MFDLATSGCLGGLRGEGLEVGCFQFVRVGLVGWGLKQYLVEGNPGGFLDSFM